jgi:hypothetical protein
VGDQIVFKARGSSGDALYSIEDDMLRKIADFTPNWYEYDGEQHLGVSATSFARLGDELFFLANTPDGFRLHRVANVPEQDAWTLALSLGTIAFAASRRARLGVG